VTAQEQKPTTVKPIEVVATRLPETPHDVPASIEVITGETLRARGVTSLRDALALAAGVTIAPGGDAGPASAVPEFWGLKEIDAFLLVVDGIPWGGALNPAVATLSLRDVERIEVLRGPAPVTFGATSFVGVIHVVHKAAAARNKYLAASGGSFGSGSLATDYALPGTGAWNSRVSVDLNRERFRDDRTGYSNGHALWRTARIDGDKRTWITADLNILKQDPASPHPREGASLSSAVPLDANANPDGASLNENRFNLAAGLDRPFSGSGSWSATASFTRSAQRQFRGFLTDISNSANNAAGYKENIDITDVYADTHILWPARSGWKFMTGADALFANGEAKGATFSYTVPLNGATATHDPEPTTLDKDAANQRLFLGVYGSTEWRPIERFTFSAGLRVNATSERRGEEGNPSVSNTRLSGSVGAMYGVWEQGDDHVRLFANYRDTFKPAAFDFSLAENEGVLDPETSTSYEGGVKLRTMQGRLDLEASAFHMDFTNLVTATVVNNLPALINSGKTRFKGVEVAADLRLAHAVFARASYSAHDGKFVDFVQAFDGVPTQLAGKWFEMSAKQLWSAGISVSPETGFIASGNVNFVGGRYLNKRNTALAPSFTTFDAGIGYRTARAEFRIDGRNLGDRRDPVAESEFGDAQYYRMTARTIRAGVVLKY
jgi:iron complex outermembrane receptor protein